MARKARPGHAQQFEQTIAVLFTCRSVINYNSSLSEEQKNELLSSIDTSVHFLQERLLVNAAIDSKDAVPFLPLSLAEMMTLSQGGAENAGENGGTGSKDAASILQGLFKLYNALLKKKEGNGLDLFVSRYNQVMSLLNEIQFKIERDNSTYLNNFTVADQIDHVRGFVTDLYTLFTEFATAISGILEGQDVYIDTEEVSSMQQMLTGERGQGVTDLAALVRVYQSHERLTRRKGSVDARVADASALLVLLEERLDQQVEKRDEVIAQIKNLIALLNDLSYLVIDYEQTAMQLLQQGNISQT